MGSADLDARGRPLVAVTGIGLVTSLGIGQEETWAGLVAGRSGVGTIRRFPIEGLRTRIAATVDAVETEPRTAVARSHRFAELAAAEAVAQAGIGRPAAFPGALFIGVPPVEVEWPQREALAAAGAGLAEPGYPAMLAGAATGRFAPWHELLVFRSIADRIADRFGTRGSPVSLSTACSSGATAIQLGAEAIRRGETEAALCIGTDGSVTPETLIRFALLSALSAQNDPPQAAAKPFSRNRDGFVMGEGAGALVLESAAAARARGATILGYLLGCGERGDGFHRTRSSPDGASIVAAICEALDDAELMPEDVDYVNAHGTGTPENDRMESLGLTKVLGERMLTVPISSNKSMIGHTLTAAGAIEAAVSLLTIRHGRLPPTINYAVPDPAIPLDVVPNHARDQAVSVVLSNSFGFGGQNSCLVLAAEPRRAAKPRLAAEPRGAAEPR